MKKLLPYIFLFLVSVTFFYRFFFQGLIPIPADIIVGLYHPWIDHQWGQYLTNVPVKNPLMSDIVSIIYQWRTEAINQIKHGIFPFWNNHFFSGLPLYANFQSSLINITNIAFFLPISEARNWGLMIYFNLLISLIFSYLYFKNIFKKNSPAIISSISYSLSIYSITWLEYGIHSYVASFLPLILFLVDRYQQTNKLKYLFLLCISISLQIYGGYPQYSIYTFIFVIIYFLVRYKFKNINQIALSSIFGIILSLPILIPGYQLTNLSIHATDLTSQASNGGFLPVQNLFTFVSPNFWGNPTTRDYFGSGFYDNNAIYPSLIALIGFFAFIPSKLSILNLITVLFCFIASTPNPFSSFLQNYFGFIFPKQGIATKIFILANFSFAYFAGLAYISSKKNIIRGIFIVFIWLSLLIINSFLTNNQIALKNNLYCLIFLIPVTLLLIKKHFLLIIFVCLELFYYGFKYLPFSPSEYIFPSTPITEFLKSNSSQYRVATFDTMPQNMWQPYNLSTVDGYDTLAPNTSYQYAYFLNYGKLPQNSSRIISLFNFNQPLISDASIKYILKISSDPVKLPTEFSSNQYRLAFWDNGVAIVENQQVLPRARFTSNVKTANNLEEMAKLLNTYQVNQAVIIGPIKFSLNQNCLDKNSIVSILSDTPNKIILDTSSSCSNLLVLADTYFPGWQATIDGISTPIYQTNINFRSIFVPSGLHQVIFNYNPFF